MAFQKATKTQRNAHIALIGPTGAGKTLTALKMAQRLLEPGKRIALIDTENASASLYSDTIDFDTLCLESFSPRDYIKAIHEAEATGEHGVLVIDSLSHAWAGKNGVLEMVDNAAKRSGSGSTFGAWRDATPEHNDLVDALVRCRLDLIVTMRSKMAYVQEKDEKTGKTTVRKIGLQPVQREGLEYEFDLIADMDVEHHFIVGKTRCSLMDGVVALKPEGSVIEPFRAWLRDGAEAPERSAASVAEAMVAQECDELRSQIRTMADGLRMTRGLDARLKAMGNNPDELRKALAKLIELDAQRAGATHSDEVPA